MDQDHAQDGAVEAECIEDAGDVDVDGQVRERLRQEEGQQDQANQYRQYGTSVYYFFWTFG
jgi:hypothetical protein